MPSAVLRTSSGTLCYTTNDLHYAVGNESFIRQLDIGDCIGKSFGDISTRSLFARNDKSSIMVSSRNMDNVLVLTCADTAPYDYYLSVLFCFVSRHVAGCHHQRHSDSISHRTESHLIGGLHEKDFD